MVALTRRGLVNAVVRRVVFPIVDDFNQSDMDSEMAVRKAVPEKQAERDAKGSRSRSMLLAVVAIGLAICVATVIVATRSRFHQMYAEFEIPVSPVTSFALGPVFPIVLAVIVTVTVAKEWIPQFGSIANVWNGSVVCLALASLAVYVVGVFAPLMTMIESLS
jgi:uncharacterized membrane protein